MLVSSSHFAFAGILLLSLVLRLWGLSNESLWLDEVTSIFIAQQSLADIIHGVGFDRHTPPAYYLLLHYWLRGIGATLIGLRSFSVFFDTLTLLTLWFLSERVFNKRAALYATFLYAVSPYAVYYAQEGRMYSLLGFEVLLTTFLVIRSRQRTLSLFESVICVGLAVLGMYTHYYYALFYAAITLAILANEGIGSKRTIQWLLLSLLVALAFLPWVQVILSLLGSGGQTFREFTALVLPYTYLRFIVGYGIMPLSYGTKEDPVATLQQALPDLVAPLFLFTLIIGFALYRICIQEKKTAAYILAPLLLPGIIAGIISLKIPMLSERYLIVSYPFFILLVVYGLLQLRSSDLGISLCIAAFFFGFLKHSTNPLFGNTNWRAAAQLIANHAPETKVIVTPEFSRGCITQNYVGKAPPTLHPDVLDSQKSSQLANLSQVWLVERADQKQLGEQLLEEGFTLERSDFFFKGHGLRVSLYTRGH